MARIRIKENDSLVVSQNALIEFVGNVAMILINDSGEVLSCNQTMTAFLKQLDGTVSIGDVADRLQQFFEGEHETIVADLLTAAEELCSKGVLERA